MGLIQKITQSKEWEARGSAAAVGPPHPADRSGPRGATRR